MVSPGGMSNELAGRPAAETKRITVGPPWKPFREKAIGLPHCCCSYVSLLFLLLVSIFRFLSDTYSMCPTFYFCSCIRGPWPLPGGQAREAGQGPPKQETKGNSEKNCSGLSKLGNIRSKQRKAEPAGRPAAETKRVTVGRTIWATLGTLSV
jgi:hypothetical protein